MKNIKLSHLRVFFEVAQQGSISGAAERLFRTPSAVSMMVTNLEQRLDKPLFEAEGKSRLTPFGQFVFEIAESQLTQFDRSVLKIQSFAKNEFGHIDICSVPSFATAYLPQLLALYKLDFSQISVNIRDNSTHQISLQIESGEIDIGISGPPDNPELVSFSPILTDPIGMVCSVEHPACSLNRRLTWSDLEDCTLISNGTCDSIQSKEFMEIHSYSMMRVENTTSLLAMIRAGLGVTTLPKLAVPSERDDLAFLEFEYQDLSRQLGLVSKKNRTLTPAAKAFHDLTLSFFNK